MEVTQELSYEADPEADENESGDGSSRGTDSVQLPPCELARLGEIQEVVSTLLLSPFKRESLALAIEHGRYCCDQTPATSPRPPEPALAATSR